MQIQDFNYFTEKLLSYVVEKLDSQRVIRDSGSFGIQPKNICKLAGRSYHQSTYNTFIEAVLNMIGKVGFETKTGKYLYFTSCVHKVGAGSLTGKQIVLDYKTTANKSNFEKIVNFQEIDFDVFKISLSKAVMFYQFLLSNKDCEEIIISYDEFKEQTEIDLYPRNNLKRILKEIISAFKSELKMPLELEVASSSKMLKITYDIFTHYPGVNSEKELSDVVDFAIATSK